MTDTSNIRLSSITYNKTVPDKIVTEIKNDDIYFVKVRTNEKVVKVVRHIE